MTNITLLGVVGGSGTTTLTALAALALTGEPEHRPTVIGRDPAPLHARLGHAPEPAPSNHELTDGGRATVEHLDVALSDGHLILVSPASARGDAAMMTTLAHVRSQIGDETRFRVAVARVDVHGTGRLARFGDVAVVDFPFDRALATIVEIPTARPFVRGLTERRLAGFVDDLRAVLR